MSAAKDAQRAARLDGVDFYEPVHNSSVYAERIKDGRSKWIEAVESDGTAHVQHDAEEARGGKTFDRFIVTASGSTGSISDRTVQLVKKTSEWCEVAPQGSTISARVCHTRYASFFCGLDLRLDQVFRLLVVLLAAALLLNAAYTIAEDARMAPADQSAEL